MLYLYCYQQQQKDTKKCLHCNSVPNDQPHPVVCIVCLLLCCRPDQIKPELNRFLQMLKVVYDTFGLTYKMALSTRPEQKLGDDAMWDQAEGALQGALDESGLEWEVSPPGPHPSPPTPRFPSLTPYPSLPFPHPQPLTACPSPPNPLPPRHLVVHPVISMFDTHEANSEQAHVAFHLNQQTDQVVRPENCRRGVENCRRGDDRSALSGPPAALRLCSGLPVAVYECLLLMNCLPSHPSRWIISRGLVQAVFNSLSHWRSPQSFLWQ